MSHRLTIKGQVTIPKAIRDYLGLREGSSAVEFSIGPDGTVLVKKASAAATAPSQAAAGAVTSRRPAAAQARRAAPVIGVLGLLAGGY